MKTRGTHTKYTIPVLKRQLVERGLKCRITPTIAVQQHRERRDAFMEIFAPNSLVRCSPGDADDQCVG